MSASPVATGQASRTSPTFWDIQVEATAITTRKNQVPSPSARPYASPEPAGSAGTSWQNSATLTKP